MDQPLSFPSLLGKICLSAPPCFMKWLGCFIRSVAVSSLLETCMSSCSASQSVYWLNFIYLFFAFSSREKSCSACLLRCHSTLLYTGGRFQVKIWKVHQNTDAWGGKNYGNTILVCSETCCCGQILHNVKGILELVRWNAWAVLAFQAKDVYFHVDRNRKPWGVYDSRECLITDCIKRWTLK